LTFTPGLTKNKSHLLHGNRQRDRLGKLERAGNRQQDAMLPFYVGFNCLMRTVDHFASEG